MNPTERPLLADVRAELERLGGELREMAAHGGNLPGWNYKPMCVRLNDWPSPGWLPA